MAAGIAGCVVAGAGAELTGAEEVTLGAVLLGASGAAVAAGKFTDGNEVSAGVAFAGAGWGVFCVGTTGAGC